MMDDELFDARHARVALMPTYRMLCTPSDVLAETRRIVPDITPDETARVHHSVNGEPVMLQTAALLVLAKRSAPHADRLAVIERIRDMRRIERIICGLEVESIDDRPIEEEEW